MHDDFESAFYRIVADCFSPDDNLPTFPPTSHATPREWMPERVADDAPVKPVTRLPRGLLTDHKHAGGKSWDAQDPSRVLGPDSWISPRTGRRYSIGETVEPDDLAPPNQHSATWEHPGNTPFRKYPGAPKFRMEGDDDDS
jgi:hypothetical protein